MALRIFGYGSLIAHPRFEHVSKVPALLAGWERRFWQGSTDHRGVPGAPGRVVTLVPVEGGQCEGVVFTVDPAHVPAVLAKLDHREKGGYERLSVELETEAGLVEAMTYRAAPGNPNYLGAAPSTAIANQISAAVGPSGPNIDYLRDLHGALQSTGCHDPHVEELMRAVEALSD